MFIDYASRPPVAEFDQTNTTHLNNYRRVYATSERMTAKEEDGIGIDPLKKYLEMYERLDAKHVVVKARNLSSTFGWKIKNEDVAAFCQSHGERFIGFTGVDPHSGENAVEELEFAIRELRLRGLNLQCFEHKLAINDKRLFPLYAKCVELDIPVNIHCGINFSTKTLMEYGRPALLDEVMVNFPSLRVCAAPPGFPWIHELIGVAWRHRNVHIGLVAVRPKYLKVAHSGYEPLLQYGRTVLQDQIIFGSSFPMISVNQAMEDINSLGLKPDIMEKWTYRNASNFLGL